MTNRSHFRLFQLPAPPALRRLEHGRAPANLTGGKATLMLAACLLCGGLFASAGWAKEVLSNGQGGGSWSSPGAWRGNAVPGPADTVIIKTNDAIVFDGNYMDQAACSRLVIDAGGRLNFKEEDAPHVFGVAGPIEVRGRINMDLTRFPQGMAEIRLLADKEEERLIHVVSNAVFIANGAPGLADGRCNVMISTGPLRPGMQRRAARFQGDPGAGIFFKDVGMAHVGEYHSNGCGGGNWSDPETWHEKIVPAGADIVVIAADDTVVFDGHSTEEPGCRKIQIDPRGVLTFKADEQAHTLNVAGPVESYGTIRMDGSKSPLGVMELRLVAEAEEERTIRMLPNSTLFLNGVEREGGHKNVVLGAFAAQAGQSRRTALVVARDETMVAIRCAELRDIVLTVYDLDNTGFKANERLSISESYFTGSSRLAFFGCDTPAVQKNSFICEAARPLGAPAIAINACKLAQIQDNVFSGPYDPAIQAQKDVDSSVTDNVISNAARGIAWSGQNAMLRGNTIAGCKAGLVVEDVNGAVEGMIVRGPELALDVQRSQVQFTDVRVENMPTNGTALFLNSSEATLLNCNIEPAQIKVADKTPTNASWVQTMNYLLVQVKGSHPQQTMVEVRTAPVSGGPPGGGAADMNVRNSPVRVNAEGYTPLPRSLRALVVRAWSLGRDGTKTNAPSYDLVVSTPDEKTGVLKTLKSMVIEPKPAWYRPDPNQLTPTVEVALP